MLDSDWLNTFKALHELARQGSLSGLELQYYMLLREQLTEEVVRTSAAREAPGKPMRRLIRVAQTHQVELALSGKPMQMLTRSLSAGGFGGLLEKDPGAGPLAFSLRVAGHAPILGWARAVAVKPQSRALFASFAFVDVHPKDIERIHTLIFDSVLSRPFETN